MMRHREIKRRTICFILAHSTMVLILAQASRLVIDFGMFQEETGANDKLPEVFGKAAAEYAD